MINLNNGSVEEFYKDEAKMMVLDILKEYVKAHPNEVRRLDIINSILEANKLDRTSADIKGKVKNLLQGYSMMNASMQSDLESLGCTVMPGKKHYKIAQQVLDYSVVSVQTKKGMGCGMCHQKPLLCLGA